MIKEWPLRRLALKAQTSLELEVAQVKVMEILFLMVHAMLVPQTKSYLLNIYL